jgi:hypothetical protein
MRSRAGETLRPPFGAPYLFQDITLSARAVATTRHTRAHELGSTSLLGEEPLVVHWQSLTLQELLRWRLGCAGRRRMEIPHDGVSKAVP